MSMTTKASFRAEFKVGERGERGETDVYLARQVNTRDENGAWSEVATAAVAA